MTLVEIKGVVVNLREQLEIDDDIADTVSRNYTSFEGAVISRARWRKLFKRALSHARSELSQKELLAGIYDRVDE